jgi:site-specific DNA-methyltransferase (adenine-specific)
MDGLHQALAPAVSASQLEQEELESLEAIIGGGLQAFVDVGQALAEIRDRRGYKLSGYATFDEYCQQRWGLSRSYAFRHIQAAQVAAVLPIGNAPANEAQARQLVPLLVQGAEAIRGAWQEAVETAPNGKLTAAHVETVVERHTSPLTVHFSSKTPEWYTPQIIIDRVLQVFDGTIDLDPCSNDGEPNVPATRHFTRTDDGLSRSWQGRVFMNPPYGDEIADWVAKLRQEWRTNQVEAIALVPNRAGTAWWQDLFRGGGHDVETACCVVSLLRGRLTFSGAESSAPFPSVVAYFGDTDRRDVFVEAFEDLGDMWIPWNWWRDGAG